MPPSLYGVGDIIIARCVAVMSPLLFPCYSIVCITAFARGCIHYALAQAPLVIMRKILGVFNRPETTLRDPASSTGIMGL